MSLPAPLLPLAAEPWSAAVLVDFDGSISAIVDDPSAARVLPEAREALAALVGVVATVGVVSGRPVEVLAHEIDLPGVTFVGQYGLERMVAGRTIVDERVEPYRDAVAAAADELDRELPGLLVERKAGLAVTVHWRTAPGRQQDAVGVVERVAQRHGLVALPTRMALELRPPVSADKGTALEPLLDGITAACFAGDDLGDVPAFEALERLATRGRLDHRACIVVRSPETAPELLAHADVVVDGPLGLVSLLEQLAGAATRTPR